MGRVIILGTILGWALGMWGGLAQAYEVSPVQNGGTIHGTVNLQGIPPEPLRFTVEKNPEVCGKERSLQKVESSGGNLRGVVVALEGIPAGKPFPAQAYTGNAPGEGEFRYLGGDALGLEVKTKGCNFGPFTGVVAADEAIHFRNDDSMKHTLHTFMSRDMKGNILRTVHNLDIHPEAEIDRTFSSGKLKDSRVVRMLCNRHDFMQNWLYVVQNPYYAITDQNGQFAIDQIPVGRYTLRVWHPILGLQEQQVEITPGGMLTANFAFSNE